jgi:hypothetical protein
MVKYLSFHNSSFAFKIGFNVNGQGHNVVDTPLVEFFHENFVQYSITFYIVDLKTL